MKILHTSDWHLGKYLDHYSRHEEQKAVMEEICEIANQEQVHAVIIAGDLFDNFNPSIEATELFYHTLRKLSGNGARAVIAIAGNHDSPDRIEAPDPLARACGIILMGYPYSKVPCFELETGLAVIQSDEGFLSVLIPGCNYPLRLLSVPYANEFRLKTFLGNDDPEEALRDVLKRRWEYLAGQYCDQMGVNILVAHLLFAGKEDDLPEEPEDEKPILHVGGAQVIFSEDIPASIQYTALGHLHRKQSVGSGISPVVYSGSPLGYSFSEANQKKFVQIIEVIPGAQPKVRGVELKAGKPLMRKRCENVDEALGWLEQHQNALVELTMVTETYLTAEERKKIMQAHSGIVHIIPEVKHPGLMDGHHQIIDLTRNMEELFSDYFLAEKNQKPNDELMDLFREVLSEEEKP